MRALREAVIQRRTELGWTQETLAGRLRCQQSMVARIESGLRKIDAYELILLERALELAPCALHQVIGDAMPAGEPFTPGWTPEDGGAEGDET